jgi:hypothetical protein
MSPEWGGGGHSLRVSDLVPTTMCLEERGHP